MTAYTPSQISAIARLFSSGVIREMARVGRSPLFARLAAEVFPFFSSLESSPVSSFYEATFKVLKSVDCRHEYIYKAALTHKILLGTHSLQTAAMLSEFRVGPCKADVAIFNGTATVYEIKSERDSLSRLERQIETYKEFFAKVYVIAGGNHIDGVCSVVSKDVGILQLSSRYQISHIREAEDRPDRTSPVVIFESIRTDEAKQILRCLEIPIPVVPNTEMHAALKDKFSHLKAADVHVAMVGVLKKTRNLLSLSDLVGTLPSSLQSVALTTPMRRADHRRLLDAVRTPLKDAMAWS